MRSNSPLAAAVLLGLATAAYAQAQDEPISLVVSPDVAVLGPGERASLSAYAGLRNGTTRPVACTWRLVARAGEARLAVGAGPTTGAMVEAGVAPALVTVEAAFARDDDEEPLRARATVLCSRPRIAAPARAPVGEAVPVSVDCPLLPPALGGEVEIEVVEAPGEPTPVPLLVAMREGPYGPVSSGYAAKLPAPAGAMQVGLLARGGGRHVLRARYRVAGRDLGSDPVVVEALPVARIVVCLYEAGPPPAAGIRMAGPWGHALPGPLVVTPPRAVAPVVLGEGPGGESLGVLLASVSTGQWLMRGRQEMLAPLPARDGAWFLDGTVPGMPVNAPSLQRHLAVTLAGAHLLDRPEIRGEMPVVAVATAAAVPLPVGQSIRLGLAVLGRSDGALVEPEPGVKPSAVVAEPGGGTVDIQGETGLALLVTGRSPGLVRVRARVQVRDRAGAVAPARVETTILVLASGDRLVCDRHGQPAPPGRTEWAVIGDDAARAAGDAARAVPEGFTATAPPVRLARIGGGCWVVPIRPSGS